MEKYAAFICLHFDGFTIFQHLISLIYDINLNFDIESTDRFILRSLIVLIGIISKLIPSFVDFFSTYMYI